MSDWVYTGNGNGKDINCVHKVMGPFVFQGKEKFYSNESDLGNNYFPSVS